MFWKRKKTETDLFSIEPDRRRTSFRVRPHEKYPVHMSIDDRVVEVVNIGAGGLAFKNMGFREGGIHSVVIRLAGYEGAISSEICIVNIEGNAVCNCSFKSIRDNDIDTIHKYMLKVQKEEIREKKLRG